MGRIGNQREPWQSVVVVACSSPLTLHNIYYRGFVAAPMWAAFGFQQPLASMRTGTSGPAHKEPACGPSEVLRASQLMRLKTRAPQKSKRRGWYRPPMMPDGTIHRRHSACPTSATAQNQPSTGWPRYAATLVAAMAPSEAAVTICRRLFCRTSPAAKSPGVEVSMRSLVTT